MEPPARSAAGAPHGAEVNAVQRERERRYLDAHSFEEAIDYLAVLERLTDNSDEIVRAALSLAAVVAYTRPFSGQHDRRGNRERGFKGLYLEVLDLLPEGPALHEHVMGLRNQYLAHYDAARARVELPEGNGPVHYMAPTPLRPEQAKQIRLLAGTMASRALQRARELGAQGPG